MAELKPVYLIWGDDETKLDAWGASLKRRVADEAPSATLEILSGDAAGPEDAATAIGQMTLSVGRRYILVDGIQRWKADDFKQVASALVNVPPETIVVLVGRADPPKRSKKLTAPAALAKAVEKAGGEVHVFQAPQLAGWSRRAVERAQALGFELDREGAESLIERVPTEEKPPHRLRQRSLMRELEKLATYAGDDRVLTAEDVDALAAPPLEARVYELADAVIAREPARALRIGEELRAQGEDMMRVLFVLTGQLRNCHIAMSMTAAGRQLDEIASELKVPDWRAKRVLDQARRADLEQVEIALELLADWDWAIRGGGELDAESAFTRMLKLAAGERATAEAS